MKIRDEYKIFSNEKLNENDIYRMDIEYNNNSDIKPGQFVNVSIPGVFLPRPISVANYYYYEPLGILTLVYKVVGEGTKIMSNMKKDDMITIMTGLGNGFDLDVETKHPLVIGGGLGVAPLYYLTNRLIEKRINPTVLLGFKNEKYAFLIDEFYELLKHTSGNIDLAFDDSGELVTDLVKKANVLENYDYFYACGPKPMLKAVNDIAVTDGEFSLEERMACGIGQCKCCSIETNDGMKTLCNDGPVLKKRLVRW